MHPKLGKTMHIVNGMPKCRAGGTMSRKCDNAGGNPKYLGPVYRKKSRRLLLLFQTFFIAITGFIFLKQHDVKHHRLEQNQDAFGPRKRQLISGTFNSVSRERAEGEDAASNSFFHIFDDTQQEIAYMRHEDLSRENQNAEDDETLDGIVQKAKNFGYEQDELGARRERVFTDNVDAGGSSLNEDVSTLVMKDTNERNNRLEEYEKDFLNSGNKLDQISKHKLYADLSPGGSRRSRVYAHPASSWMNPERLYFYRFTNVRIGEDGNLDVYGIEDDSEVSRKPFNIVGSTKPDETTPSAPSSIILQDGKDSRTIQVRYHQKPTESELCQGQIDSPTMLFHRESNSSMWNTWTRSILPVFHTLREIGALPIIEISADGDIREVLEGLPLQGDCPKIVDVTSGLSQISLNCSSKHEISEKLPKNCTGDLTWCSPGMWPASMASNGIPKAKLLYASESAIDHPWASLFTSMSSGVYSWDSFRGVCLRNLIVGTSAKITTKHPLPSGGEGGAPVEELESVASGLHIFAKFIVTVHRRLEKTNAVDFSSYGEWHRDRLRRGISRGRTSLKYIDKAFFKPASLQNDITSEYLLDDWEDLKANHGYVFGLERFSLTSEESMSKVIKTASDVVHPSPIGPPKGYKHESPLPVVTYITRFHDLKRSVLNERQILRYIGWNYDVKLRVTTLNEHVGAAASILARTDVLIGMYGDDWYKAIFLKPGASTLQLFPYKIRNPNHKLLMGNEITNLVHLLQGNHLNWVNPHQDFSFFRREDFSEDPDSFRVKPDLSSLHGYWSQPNYSNPHSAWLNANSYVDLNHVGPYIDEIMKQAGIPKVERVPRYLWEWDPPLGNLPCKAYPCENSSEEEAEDEKKEVDLEVKENYAEDYADSVQEVADQLAENAAEIFEGIDEGSVKSMSDEQNGSSNLEVLARL